MARPGIDYETVKYGDYAIGAGQCDFGAKKTEGAGSRQQYNSRTVLKRWRDEHAKEGKLASGKRERQGTTSY